MVGAQGVDQVMVCALFPERVLPVRSSLLTHTLNPSGSPGSLHWWTGVGIMHSCERGRRRRRRRRRKRCSR